MAATNVFMRAMDDRCRRACASSVLPHDGKCARSCATERFAHLLFEGASLILTHGFVKKERRTPLAELQLARDRKRQWEGTSHDK